MGCDDHPVASDLVGGAFQSTHPSGVRLVAAVLAWFGLDISIHAPQWGATWMRLAGRCSPGFQSTHPSGVRPRSGRCQPARPRISIHAPQWGATAISATGKDARGDFNPRTPVGCDVPVLVLACIGDRISIHAPQWGATSAYHQSPAGALFQSTHPSGVRPTDSAAIVRCKQFQSTHPSGVRLVPAPP